MTYFKSSNRMLLISNDSFIVGLLTGYCVANHLILDGIACSRPLHAKDINKKFKLIIIDLRQLSSPLIEANLELLQQIHNDYHIPICAIHNHSGKAGEEALSSALPWIDCYIGEPIIEQLDEYFNKNFINHSRLCNDRRVKARRTVPDRRSLADPTGTHSSHHISNTNILLDKDINYYVLGPFEIDLSCRTVFLKGKNLELTCKEFKLFSLLAENFERVYTAEEIIKHLWPQTHRATKSDLYQYMHLLRKKVEQDPDNPYWILTVKGVGYKLHVVNHVH